MQNFAALLALLSLNVALTVAHDGHEHELQMPLDYVKFPYQASYYPGDDEGTADIESFPRI